MADDIEQRLQALERDAHPPIDLGPAMAKVLRDLVQAQHDARVSELLAANNREVERRRDLSREVERLKVLVDGTGPLRDRIKRMEDQIYDLQCRLAMRDEHLRLAARCDQSPGYTYGQARPYDGRIPGPGDRWLTPREIARRALNEPDLATAFAALLPEAAANG